ncbi:MAG: chemotaxis protein CheW [Planctomycetota bacterium]
MSDTRDEQSQLMRAMQDYLQVVSFRLGAEEYAIEITTVKEIILVEGITAVPQMPDYVEGVINLRGNVIPVLDLRRRFALDAAPFDEQTRIVVVRLGARIIGLIVDAVSQVMRIPRGDIQDPPATIAGLAGEHLVGIARLAERMVLLLDIEQVLGPAERSALEVDNAPGAA